MPAKPGERGDFPLAFRSRATLLSGLAAGPGLRGTHFALSPGQELAAPLTSEVSRERIIYLYVTVQYFTVWFPKRRCSFLSLQNDDGKSGR